MNILAIETSSQACSVALSLNGTVTQRHEILNNQHSEFLLKFTDGLIADSKITKHDLHAVAVGNGPGSFTGLRLGIGVAQGIASGLNIPVVPVSSLLTIASQCKHQFLLVAVDARMGEVYWQCFEMLNQAKFKTLTQPCLNKPGELKLPRIDGSWFGLGSGWDQYSSQLQPYLEKESDWAKGILPKASIVASQAQILLNKGEVDLQRQVLPSYVRNKVTG